MMKRKVVVALSIVAAASPVAAQSIPAADSLLRVGLLARAESEYYAAARVRPHDPIARWALGRYLVARGAPRVGATLLEESLKFGGEPAVVGRDLAPVYLSIGEYKSLAALPTASADERARARWFVAHEPRVVAPESVLVALYSPPTDSTSLGHLPIRINGKTVDAAVSARVQGILVADSATAGRGLRRFASAGDRAGSPTLAAADSVSIGRLSLVNFPVAVGRIDAREGAVIGLDVLSRFAPTFDPKAGRLTLHVSGSLTSAPLGDRFSTFAAGSDLRIVEAGGWISIMQPQVANMLRDRRWTVDAKRGQLIIER